MHRRKEKGLFQLVCELAVEGSLSVIGRTNSTFRFSRPARKIPNEELISSTMQLLFVFLF